MSGENNINSQNQSNIRNQFILKGGVKKEQVDNKYHQLFDMFDSDGNKTLDSNEASSLSSLIANINKKDSENDYKKPINDFAKNLSLAAKDIIDSKTITNSNGEKTIITSYNNGIKETITYYPDGEIKMKHIEKKVTEITYTIDGKEYTQQEYEKMLERKFLSSNKNSETLYIKPKSINIIPNTNTRMVSKTEFSERAQQELREFAGEHFKETVDEQNNLIQKFDYTSGDLDKFGLFVSDTAQELFSKASGKEYNTYAELVNQTRKNIDKSSNLYMAGKVTPNSPYAIAHPEYNFETVYKNTTGHDYNIMQANEFQQTVVKYKTLTGLKQRTEMLNNAIKTVEKLYKEEQLRKQGITVANRDKTYDQVLMEALTQYFDGNSELAATFLSGLASDINSKDEISPEKMISILKEIKTLTEKRYNNELGGEKYENLKSRYLNEYKEFYGVENKQDEIEANLATGQATGEMIKMGAVIATSIMLGGSNLVQQGGEALVKKIGTTAAKEVIRLDLALGVIAESYGIDLLNAMSSQEGLTEEKYDNINQRYANTLPYTIFGVYVSGPIGESVKNVLRSNPGFSTNLLNRIFTKSAGSIGFISEVGADTLFERILNGNDISEAFGSNAKGEAFARFMNMIVGGRVNKATLEALQNIEVQQEKLPNGSIEYIIKNQDVEYKTKNPDEVVSGVLGFVMQKSAEGRNIKLMPDGTLVEYDQNGKPTVLNEAVKSKSAIGNNKDKNDIPLDENGYPIVSFIDKISNDGNFYGRKVKDFSSSQAQRETGAYLDKLLSFIPESQVNDNIGMESFKSDKDFILPDGTIISRKAVGSEKILVNEYGWPIGQVAPTEKKMVFWVQDVTGKKHVLAAYNKSNYQKALRIWNYIRTLEEIPRENINEVQQNYRINKNMQTNLDNAKSREELKNMPAE